jgi:hypothetical protein
MNCSAKAAVPTLPPSPRRSHRRAEHALGTRHMLCAVHPHLMLCHAHTDTPCQCLYAGAVRCCMLGRCCFSLPAHPPKKQPPPQPPPLPSPHQAVDVAASVQQAPCRLQVTPLGRLMQAADVSTDRLLRAPTSRQAASTWAGAMSVPSSGMQLQAEPSACAAHTAAPGL